MADNSPAVRCSIGIDVSKDSLDIFIDSSAEECRVHNAVGDIVTLVKRLRAAAPIYETASSFCGCVIRRLVSMQSMAIVHTLTCAPLGLGTYQPLYLRVRKIAHHFPVNL